MYFHTYAIPSSNILLNNYLILSIINIKFQSFFLFMITYLWSLAALRTCLPGMPIHWSQPLNGRTRHLGIVNRTGNNNELNQVSLGTRAM